MGGSVILLLILAGIASFSFIALSTNSEKVSEQESKILEFSTFTSAVCENKEDLVHCKDEIFVNCNGNISKAVDVAECSGIKLDVSKATGSAVFEKGWEDPRN